MSKIQSAAMKARWQNTEYRQRHLAMLANARQRGNDNAAGGQVDDVAVCRRFFHLLSKGDISVNLGRVRRVAQWWAAKNRQPTSCSMHGLKQAASVLGFVVRWDETTGNYFTSLNPRSVEYLQFAFETMRKEEGDRMGPPVK